MAEASWVKAVMVDVVMVLEAREEARMEEVAGVVAVTAEEARAADQRVASHQVADQRREVEAARNLFIGGTSDQVLAVDAREVNHHLAVVGTIEDKPRLVLIAQAAIGADADAGADQGALDAIELGEFLLGPIDGRSGRVTRRALKERKDLSGHTVVVSHV